MQLNTYKYSAFRISKGQKSEMFRASKKNVIIVHVNM
jgi:hypothetical protein